MNAISLRIVIPFTHYATPGEIRFPTYYYRIIGAATGAVSYPRSFQLFGYATPCPYLRTYGIAANVVILSCPFTVSSKTASCFSRHESAQQVARLDIKRLRVVRIILRRVAAHRRTASMPWSDEIGAWERFRRTKKNRRLAILCLSVELAYPAKYVEDSHDCRCLFGLFFLDPGSQ